MKNAKADERPKLLVLMHRSKLMFDDMELGAKAYAVVFIEDPTIETFACDGEHFTFNTDWLASVSSSDFAEIFRNLELSPRATIKRGLSDGVMNGDAKRIEQIQQRLLAYEIRNGIRQPHWPYEPVDPLHFEERPGFSTSTMVTPCGQTIRYQRRV